MWIIVFFLRLPDLIVTEREMTDCWQAKGRTRNRKCHHELDRVTFFRITLAVVTVQILFLAIEQ